MTRPMDDADSRPPLRVMTCGAVDDGKSTLIGRLLHEQDLIFDDQRAALTKDSVKHGSTGDEPDYALLLDGLQTEREQGITIDVAYRYFATRRRAFIVADAPGHEQYTRNMATAASTSDVAVLLVDARKGLTDQTHRHAIIAAMLGVRSVVLAINKVDLVDFDQAPFRKIVDAFFAFSGELGFNEIRAIPMSARYGDNVGSPSARTPWYDGPTLLDYLETAEIDDTRAAQAFRMPVQWVNRPHAEFRGFAGTLAAGTVRPSDEIVVLPSGQTGTVARVIGGDGDLELARAGDAVTVTLAEDIDVGRGAILAAMRDRPQVANQFAAHVVWLAREPLYRGRSYLMKINHNTLPATVTSLKHQIDIHSLAKLAAKTLHTNEAGVCNLSVPRPIAFDAYANNRDTGSFILIDRVSNETVAAGMIDFALRRASNIHYHHLTVGKAERTKLMHHRPAVLWFTGLPASGKSTIANLVETTLHARGIHTLLLDGDNIRHGINKDLGFTESDRIENIRRIGEIARLMTEAGLVVLCSFISPFRADRQMVRELIGDKEFMEIFVDTPLEDCIARDPKGLYQRALAGEIDNFTGIDQPYEAPESPDLHLLTTNENPATMAERVTNELTRRGIFSAD